LEGLLEARVPNAGEVPTKGEFHDFRENWDHTLAD